jgi:hypothetical protein
MADSFQIVISKVIPLIRSQFGIHKTFDNGAFAMDALS